MKKHLLSYLLCSVCAVPLFAQDTDNAGVLIVPVGENTEPETGSPDAAEGFAISINGQPVDGNDPEIEDIARRVDQALANRDIQVRFDGLDVEPRLDFEILSPREDFTAGERVRVQSLLNYPRFVTRGELRVVDLAAVGGPRTVAVVDIAPNGTATFVVPEGDNLVLSHRVYDSAGRFDRTGTRLLNSDRAVSQTDGNEDGLDNTVRRRIPIIGGAVTVSGEGLPPGATVQTLGETVQTDGQGAFVLQRVLPPGSYAVGVESAGTTILRPIAIPESDWFYVATADLTFGRRTGDLFGDDTFTEGRLSFFVDGRRASGTKITASLDTGEDDLDEIFRRLDERDPVNTLRRIDPNDLFPTFGDDSILEEAAPTSGRFFLRVERDGNFFQWGDTQANIDGGTYLRNERELYGASGRWESQDQTSFGEPRFSFSGFAALPDQLPQRDIFQATEGSIFFLSRQDIAIGTERITVQLRDSTTGRVLSTETLQFGTDYTINYFQGVVTLTRPLTQSFASDGVVISEPGGDQDVSLTVQYEFTPLTGDVDTVALGGRAEAWVNDRLRIGVTGQSEETVTDRQEAIGFDLRYRLSEESYLALDVAETSGPGFDANLSSDGGLVFDTDEASGGDGSAIRAEAHLDLRELGFDLDGAVGAYAERRTEGFSTLDYLVTTDSGDEDLFGVYADVQVSERLSFQVFYDDFESGNGEFERVGEVSVALALASDQTLAFGLEYTDENRGVSDIGSRTDLGVRWARVVSDDLQYYAFAQATLDTSGLDRNDRIGFGGAVALSDTLSLEGEISGGTSGPGVEALLSFNDGDGTTRYAGYTLTPGRDLSGVALNGRDRGQFILGGQRDVTDQVSIFSENSYDAFGDRRSLTNTFGVNYDPNENTGYTVAITAGTVRDEINGDFDRDAITLGFQSKTETLSGGARVEYRSDEGSINGTDRDIETFAISSDLARKFDEERRLVFSLDATTSDSDGLTTDGDFVDFNAGYAFRPIKHDRFNMLASYRFLYDTFGQEIDGFDISGPVQRTHVVNLDTVFEFNERFEFGAKFGARLTDSAPSALLPMTENNALLAVANMRWHVVSKWDALFEVRALDLQSSDQTEVGSLAAVYRHVGDNWKIGVGYNFSEFSDDLTDLTLDDRGVFLNIVAKF